MKTITLEKLGKLPLFGRKMRILRRDHHLTQEQLAEKVGMSREMIAYLESRSENPTADVIRKFADFFHVSTDVFLYDEKEENRHPGPKSKFERQIGALRRLPQAKRKLASDLLDTVLKNSPGLTV
jgi:transcriptional regulator with XRE-family HTH domain